jgi:allophanate hydrolase
MEACGGLCEKEWTVQFRAQCGSLAGRQTSSCARPRIFPSGTTITELLHAYRSGQATPSSVAGCVLDAIDAYADPAVWISRVAAPDLLARAKSLESDPSARNLPLFGIPFAVKDNIDTLGLPTTAGCPAFATLPTANARAVQLLLDAGAMLVGKTNLDQFATGLVGTRSPYGAPRCVFDADYISGGSSSGSAVAVAAGLVCFALGTDTAGSGRVPAGFNNIVGLKPTKGLVSTTGVVPACRSLDCVSIFTLTVDDALSVLRIVQQEDPSDPYARADAARPLPTGRFRFGVLPGADRVFHGDSEAERLYDAAIANLCALGGTCVPIDYAPFQQAASLLYDGPYIAERLAAIEPFFTRHKAEIDPVVRRIIETAESFSAADAYRGAYRLAALAREAARQFEAIDVLLLPTSPTIHTVASVQADPVRLNTQLGRYTNFVNLLDYAALAVPAGFRANGLPAGVTLVGPAFSDRALAGLGAALHAASGAGSGLARKAVPPPLPQPPAEPPGRIAFAVAGAHLSFMPLNHQLIELGATLVATTRTAATYRLLALAGTVPPKPGLIRAPGFQGDGIEVEIWSLSEAAFGRFVAELPQPMGIGRVQLADGSEIPGFICEPCAMDGATDISHFGGWRAYTTRP